MADTATPILVTGGAGYIGSHTALYLQQNGYLPIVVDDLLTSFDSSAVKFGPFAKGDIGDAAFIANVCQQYKPQGFIHFAAFSLVGESVANPQKYFADNVDKAKVFFETAARCGVRHGVFSSTAAVYGIPAGTVPINETFAKQPINPYGESKLKAEDCLRHVESMTSVALRYFNAAGAAAPKHGIGEKHTPETHLIPNVIMAALPGGKPLQIFGTDYVTPDGTCIRDYIHVTDLADAHLRALRYLFDGGATDVCNLGTGQGYSVAEVVQAVEAEMGVTVNRSYGERRQGDPPMLVADNTKARGLLGWQPQRDLSAIIKSAVAWHRTDEFKQFMAARLV